MFANVHIQNQNQLTADQMLGVIEENIETRVAYQGNGVGGRRIKQIAVALQVNTALTEIDFAQWEMGSAGGKQLSKFLKVNQTIRKLRFNNNNIGAEGGDAIAFALLKNRSVTDFEYTFNYISALGISAIGRHLAKYDTLRHLKLSTASDVAENGNLAIAKALKINRGLVTLDMNFKGDEAITTLMQSLKVNKTLQKLVLQNLLYEAGMKALHGAREELSLKELECKVSMGTRQPNSSAQLAEFLAAIKTISQLRLDNSWLPEDAVATVCKGIEKNTSLIRLSLVRCHITDKNVHALEKALVVNKSLTDVNLRSNEIERGGCFCLLDVLRKNRRIQHLDVSLNHKIPDNMRPLFAPLLKSNQDFQQEKFLRQLDSDKTLPWQRCRLMVVGEGGAGKTATVRALTNKRFDGEWKSTIGIAMEECKTTTKGIWAEASRGGFAVDMANRLMVEEGNKRRTKLDKKKDKGKPKLKKPRRGSAVLERELEEKEEEGEKKEDEVKTALLERGEAGGMVKVSNEKDEDVGKVQGQDLGKNEGTRKKVEAMKMDDSLFVETKNNMDSIKMTIFDMGGQRVFYTIHHLFLTSNAVYLVIFSLPELQKHPQKSLAFLQHWIDSISIHAPIAPILFVGTFLDQLEQGSLQTVMHTLFDAFSGVATQDKFMAISNRTGEGVASLRDKIDATIVDQSFVYTPVSVRWMKALDAMVQSQRPWTTYASFRVHAKASGVTSMAEMNEALKLFHLFGSVLYFDSTESLKDLIVHDPQWLVDQVSAVIRDARVHGLASASLRQAGLQEDGELLLSAGICSRDLLEFLWERDQAEYLISLMQSLLLMSPIRLHESDSVSFLVPSMASVEKHLNESEMHLDEHCQFVFETIPQGVFERIVCTCVTYSEAQQGSEAVSQKPLISRHQGVVWFGPEQRVVLERDGHEGTVLDLYIQGPGNVSNTVAIMETMLQKVKLEFMNGSLEWTTQIKADETWIQFATAKKQCRAPWFDKVQEVQQEQSPSLQLDSFLSIL